MNTTQIFNNSYYLGFYFFESCKNALKGVFSLFQTVRAEQTPEEAVSMRKLAVQKDLSSESDKLQKLYFDTHSSTVKTAKQLTNKKTNEILSGGPFDNAIISLRQDLEAFIKFNRNIPMTEMEEICRCLHMLKNAEEIALILSAIGSTSSKTQKEILRQHLQKVVAKQLANMHMDEQFLFPFGYGNDGSFCGFDDDGHVVILEIARKGIDSCEIKFFNTGEGAEYHLIEEKGVNHFYPLIYKSSFSHLKDEKTLEDLTKFSSSTLMSKKLTMDDIYIYFINHFGSGNIDMKNSYSEQGDIGNCQYKSLQVWLHSRLANCRSYHEFRAFRLAKTLKEVNHLKDKDFLYVHPYFQYPRWVANLFGKKNWSYSIPKEDVNTLIDYGRIIKDHRNKKI